MERRGLGVWTLSNFRAFTAEPHTDAVSTIYFTISNSSTTSTSCSHSLAPGSSKTPVDPDNYFTCTDPMVSFKYGGTWLAITTISSDSNAGSMTTSFGNISLEEQCYVIPDGEPLRAGYTCEMPMPEFSLPVLQSTIISHTETMPPAMKAHIAEGMSIISSQKESTYTNALQGKWKNDTAPIDTASDLHKRQFGTPSAFTITNFVSHNFNPVPNANSDVSFDVSVLGLSTHCSASRGPGQGSAATGAYQGCAFSEVAFNWTNPLSIGTSLTLPNLSGGSTTYSANISLTGFCINEASNGQNVFSAGNRCMSTSSVNTAPVSRIVANARGVSPVASPAASFPPIATAPGPAVPPATSSSTVSTTLSPTISMLPYNGSASDADSSFSVSLFEMTNAAIIFLTTFMAFM